MGQRQKGRKVQGNGGKVEIQKLRDKNKRRHVGAGLELQWLLQIHSLEESGDQTGRLHSTDSRRRTYSIGATGHARGTPLLRVHSFHTPFFIRRYFRSRNRIKNS